MKKIFLILMAAMLTACAIYGQVPGTPYITYGQYYTVSFDANGGTGTTPASLSDAYIYTAPANPYTRAGYTFTGWNTATDGSGSTYAAGTTFYPTANSTLYAQWGQNGVAGSTAGTCTVGTVANDNGATACGTTRTWQCVGPNGGATANGSVYNGDCPVVGSTPGTCTKGTVTNDNGATACGTTRTWQCVLNGYTANGSRSNDPCRASCNGSSSCNYGIRVSFQSLGSWTCGNDGNGQEMHQSLYCRGLDGVNVYCAGGEGEGGCTANNYDNMDVLLGWWKYSDWNTGWWIKLGGSGWTILY